MKPLKITLIISDIAKSYHFEWLYKFLDTSRVDVSFIFIGENRGSTFNELELLGARTNFVKFNSKWDYPKAFISICILLLIRRPDVVHTHLFKANLIGLLAAWLLRVKKRIYTRHHSTFHHDYYPKAVKWDLLNNKLSTKIIAISKNVADVLAQKEKVVKSKIVLIHHGFDIEMIQKVSNHKIKKVKNKYQLSNSHQPIVGVISRFLSLKGIKYIIEAFKLLRQEYPNATLVLANSSGADAAEINKILKTELAETAFLKIKFEEDIYALYNCFDLFVHVPINKTIEAFGQIYIESLIVGIPSIFTLSGVATEFIEHKKNAWVVDYKSSEEIYEGMRALIENYELRDYIIENGKNDVKQFSFEAHINRLIDLYNK